MPRTIRPAAAARTRRVRADEVELELRGVGRRDADALELPEAGVDAVHRGAGLERGLHHLPPGRDPLAVGGVERRRRRAARDGLEVLERRHRRTLPGDIRPAYTIGVVSSADTAAAPAPPHEADPLVVTGPALTLRYATAADAPRLLELASDPAVTRWFSWGPYSAVGQPEAYIAGLPAKRSGGVLLDFLVVHPDDGPVGVTGLSELAVRDRRATVGSWFGQAWWGSGSTASRRR